MCFVWLDLEWLQQMQPERVRISWNLAEVSRQCCLCSLSSVLCQGSKWLKWYERLTSIQKVLGLNPCWIVDFFLHVFIARSLSENLIINACWLKFNFGVKSWWFLDYISVDCWVRTINCALLAQSRATALIFLTSYINTLVVIKFEVASYQNCCVRKW